MNELKDNDNIVNATKNPNADEDIEFVKDKCQKI